jgi:prepilin-type N-terminal cleavage/methylation domain-containing protein
MKARHGFTLTDLLVAVAVLGVCAGLLLPAASGARFRPASEVARRILCRNNLNQMAKGMATYLNEHGDNRWYPCPLGRGRDPKDFNGAEWLASLYWTAIVPDPDIYLCPSTFDTNLDGRDLGTFGAIPGRFGDQTVSYAGMHYKSLTNEARVPTTRAIPDIFPPNMPMASDDTQGQINHGTATSGGMAVLFFDSHVEFKTHRELDLRTAVGAKPSRGRYPLLWMLRN